MVLVTPIEDVFANSQPDWSLDGKEIAYTSGKDGKIWIFDIATETSKQLTYGDGAHRDPLWSPDGRYLAYLNELPSGEQWQVIRLDTRKAVAIEGQVCAGWSPSGRRFGSIPQRGYVNVFENGVLLSMEDGHYVAKKEMVRCAKWVTDSQIAVCRSWKGKPSVEFEQHEVYLFDVDKRVRQPRWLPAENLASAKLLPSKVAGGESLVVDFSRREMGGQIIDELKWESYLVWADALQSGFHRLSNTKIMGAGVPGRCVAEDWSPDASKVLFTRGREMWSGQQWSHSGTQILVVNTDDTGLQYLTDGYAPKWSPDGHYIAFLRSPREKVYELWVMEVE
jgi:dipeptidyl aminopeptidase/acylaminoacyl peptidase